MKRATKLGRPPKVISLNVTASSLPPPDAESGHNLFLQLERLTALVADVNERTKRLEAAVVPPSAWGRVKSAVGI